MPKMGEVFSRAGTTLERTRDLPNCNTWKRSKHQLLRCTDFEHLFAWQGNFLTHLVEDDPRSKGATLSSDPRQAVTFAASVELRRIVVHVTRAIFPQHWTAVKIQLPHLLLLLICFLIFQVSLHGLSSIQARLNVANNCSLTFARPDTKRCDKLLLCASAGPCKKVVSLSATQRCTIC